MRTTRNCSERVVNSDGELSDRVRLSERMLFNDLPEAPQSPQISVCARDLMRDMVGTAHQLNHMKSCDLLRNSLISRIKTVGGVSRDVVVVVLLGGGVMF